MHHDKDRGLSVLRPPIGSLKFVIEGDAEEARKGRWGKDPALVKTIAEVNDRAQRDMSHYRKKAVSGSGWDPNALGTLLYGLENLRKRPGGQDQDRED